MKSYCCYSKGILCVYASSNGWCLSSACINQEVLKCNILTICVSGGYKMTCKDCLYNKNCQFLAGHKTADVNGCTAFEDKSEWVHLPCKPLPVLKNSNPCNTNVYCPSCGKNLSGYYVGSLIDIAVCFKCGEIFDITKSTAGEKK